MKPNIVFLIIDSLRADKIKGKTKTAKTPFLDNLLKNGTYFSQGINSIASTLPAISSICNGKYAFRIARNTEHELPWKSKSYLDLLKENGYV